MRWGHAINGLPDNEVAGVPYEAGAVDTAAFNSSRMGANFDQDTYVAVGTSDYQREVVLWNELRYSNQGFATIPQQEGVDRVVSNGQFDLYYVSGNETAAGASA
jgi:hypothetical protein